MKDELKRLRMNLQHFAEGDGDGGGSGEGNPNPDDKGGQGEPGTGDNPGKKGEGNGDQNTVNMTQEQFDKIIADRLDRERKKQEDEKQKERDEAERKRLEENEEYKELSSKKQEEIDRLQGIIDQQKTDSIEEKKTTALSQAGYSDAQIELLRNTTVGETEEEIKQSVESLKSVVPPTPSYVDPSPMNGEKTVPSNKDGRDVGKSVFDRLKIKNRI